MPEYTPSYLIGVDLGERRDYTAIAVLQRFVTPGGPLDTIYRNREAFSAWDRVQQSTLHSYHYHLIDLQRWRGKGYSPLVPTLREIMAALRQAGFEWQREQGHRWHSEARVEVLVDHTGVGIAVVEDLRGAGIECQAITITGGDQVTNDRDDWRVPKRELVARMQVLLETDRLRIAEDLDLATTLVAELDNFRVKKITLTGNDSYGAGADWRDGNHDDLVLAVSMAAWYSEYDMANHVEGLESMMALDDYMRRQ